MSILLCGMCFGAVAFILFSVMIVALAWCHHPEGLIKYYKNRRKKRNER